MSLLEGPVRGELAARQSAQRLMKAPKDRVLYEPAGSAECHAAVEELAAAFADAGETFREIVDNSRGGAESLSTDSFQGLSEIVQNANDTGATSVAFELSGNVLEVRHNGRRVNLRDLRAMSVPWLTTKSDDPTATGRFGVGLSTLHAVAETFEVHSGQYHVRIGDPFLTNLHEDPREATDSDETLLRVKFRDETVSEEAFLRWCDEWDDSALLFLNNVHEVRFDTSASSRALRLTVRRESQRSWDLPGGGLSAAANLSVVRAPDGRRWLRATSEVPSPQGVQRNRKRKGKTTPLGVALPLFGSGAADGMVYAGLPVVTLPGIPALVNAQFDPVTSRQELLATAWNRALTSLVDGLWEATIRHLFDSQPKRAWRCIPLGSRDDAGQALGPAEEGPATGEAAELVALLVSRIRRRADGLPAALTLMVEAEATPLARLAVESMALTGLLTDIEIVELSGMDRRLPDDVRDEQGRWRLVLNHWREQTGLLPREVTVRDALRVLDHPVRPVSDVIRLTAAALEAGHASDLLDLACVVDEMGRAHVPPPRTSPFAFTTHSDGLATDLNLAICLHGDYSRLEPAATAVLDWLTNSAALIATDSDLPILERLAAAGNAGNPVDEPFSDGALRRLRASLEPLDLGEVQRLGRGIGRAIFIDGYEFNAKRAALARPVRPCDAYIPKRIDTVKDGFFTAAGTTTGIVWAANRYVDVLRSDLPRGAGLGSQKFLRALGAAMTARVIRHPSLESTYKSSNRKGLKVSYWDAPTEWRRAVRDLEASHTLDDWDSPDLTRVLHDIASDKNAKRRRQRAAAIIETLGRAWRDVGDHLDVDAAWAMHGWHVRGRLHAYWLWKAAVIPWLDNSDGTPTAPIHLRRRSTANIAVFGDDPEAFIHRELSQRRPEVLNHLGVAREPSTKDLVQRLRALREEDATDTTFAECATVYVALASRVSGTSIGLTARQLREQLAERGGLIRTATGWAPPTGLLSGEAIFGHRRLFTPNIPGAEQLWRFLQIPSPRIDDCLRVLGDIAKPRQPLADDDEAIVIQTLRLLDDLLSPRKTDPVGRRASTSNRVRARLASMPLWTSQGWISKRPIFVVDDPQLVEGIGDALPIWSLGADPVQFIRLFPSLRLTPIGSTDASINHPDKALVDDESTERFHRALEHFKADLARNAPETEQSLTVSWKVLESLDVRVHPLLEATITPTGRDPIVISMHAKIDPSQPALFIRDDDELDRVDGVGRALAALFTADERLVAYAWLAALHKEREGQRVRALELASERAARETQDAEEQMKRLRSLQTEVAETASKRTTKKKHASAEPAPATGASVPSTSPRTPRHLVDIAALVVTDAAGRIVNETDARTPRRGDKAKKGETGSGTGKTGGPPATPETANPDRTKAGPKRSTSYRAYSDGEKERLGLRVASRVLAGDADALHDIRNQRNVGADAIDELGRFYELKVFANDEGDTITLEPSQIARAMTEPKFFLVIVSGLEGKHARPQVRVIVDPLRQLHMAKESKVKFSGVQEARGLVFNLDNLEDATS